MKALFLTLFVVLLMLHQITAQFSLDIETGMVSTAYNDVRIPGDGGTFVSLSDEFDTGTQLFYRLKVGYHITERQEVNLLLAPLKFEYTGLPGRDVMFRNSIFAADQFLEVTYKFNSYRISYRYHLVNKENLGIGLGFTVKLRDAYIDFAGGGITSRKDDLGIVPLINFVIHWEPTDRWGLLLDGDALAAPQGRAEDVLLAVSHKITESFMLKAGYRLLEGGADNNSVYTFSMFHYAAVGLLWTL